MNRGSCFLESEKRTEKILQWSVRSAKINVKKRGVLQSPDGGKMK